MAASDAEQPLHDDADRPESPLDQADDQTSLQDGEPRHHHSLEMHNGDAFIDPSGDGSDNGHTERTSSAGGNGKIFIGGLSWDTTTEKLESHFKKYGEITDAVIMRDRGSGTPRGFGFVTFADPNICDRVLQDKHVLDGRTVECKRSIPRENMSVVKGPKTKKIFVGGIPPSITEEEFKNYFIGFGNVIEHQIMQDHNTGRSRGFGFIVFDSEQTVEDVLAHGRMHELGGKQVEIKKAEPKKAMQDSAPGYGPSRSGYSGSNHYGYSDYGMGGYGGSSYRAGGSGYGSRGGMYNGGGYGGYGGGYGGYGGGAIGVGGYGGGSMGGGYMGSYGGGGYATGMLGGYGDDGYGGMSYGGYGGGGYGSGYGGSGSYSSGYGHSSRGHSHGGGSSAGRYHPYSRY